MPPASSADSVLRRRSATSLARAPSIPQRRRAEISAATAKRVAVVLRRGMRQSEFRSVEQHLSAHDLVCAPILAGQRKASAEGAVCGLIITGGDMEPSNVERDLIATAVAQMLERGAPVLAMSEAVPHVVEAAGGVYAGNAPLGVLVHGGVQLLETPKDVEDAFKLMAKSPSI